MDRPRTEPPPRQLQREIAWLAGGAWLVAFAVMAAGAATSLLQPFAFGLARAALLAVAGAALSLVLWLLVGSVRGAIVRRVGLLLAGLVLAVALHVQFDVFAADLLRALLDIGAPHVMVAGDSPVRAYLMRLVAETSVVVLAAAHAMFGLAAGVLQSASDVRERERALGEARAAATEARLAALRYQLNPHFMFNTLNAIGSLVESGRSREAGEMIDRLSTFLRSTLGVGGGPCSTLDDEVATIQAYLGIEAVRFRDRLRVVIDIPGDLGRAQLPSFVLQPLVENAIRYAVAPALRPVSVRLSARRDGGGLVVEVDDDGAADAAAGQAGAGVGLCNVRDRLALMYGPAARLDSGRTACGYRAAIHLPLSCDVRAEAA